MSLIIPVDVNPEIRSVLLQIDDRLDVLDQGVAQALTDEPNARQLPTQTFSAQGGMLPTFNYTNPVVNVVSFLDPLWQQLRANEVALREVRIDSIENIHLKANSITARNLRADSVTADKISVNELSAITADIGTITAGNLTIDTSGFIRGGATGYDSGIGFWLGYDTSAYKFFIGDSTGNKLLFDGTNLTITGAIAATSGTIGGFNIGSDRITDTNDTMGLYSVTSSTQVVLWTGQTFASKATANFRVYSNGDFVAISTLLLTVPVGGTMTINGDLKVGTYTATPGAITGYITIKDAGGTARKIAVTT